MSSPATGRFHSLDAMRGFAAIGVLLFHVSFFDGQNLAPGGNLAVDFFFVLSGFVIERAYGSRLASKLSTGTFTELRLVRLYPLFLLGVVFGAIKEVVQIKTHAPTAPSLNEAVVIFLTNPLMLPAPGGKTLFPLNGPAWSLFLEVLINIVYAVALLRLRRTALACIAAVSGCALAYGAVTHGTLLLGPDWATVGYGVARVGFSFPVGVLIAGAFRDSTRRQSYLFVVPMLLLTCMLTLAVPPALRGYADAGAALLVLPTLVWMGALWEVPARLLGVAAFLGDISYPLYAVHYSLLIMFVHVEPKLHVPAPVAYLAFAGAMIALSALLVRFYDAPVRASITRQLRIRRSAPAQIL